MDNTIVETKVCKNCNSNFDITQSDLEFYDKISPSFAGHKFQIPTPTLCPECRQRRRLSFRNERKLYRRQCDASQKSIISIYSPDKPYKVYDQSIWWSDSRDAMDYGCEFDFTRTFTEQFGELMMGVPHCSLFTNQCENSEYTNYANGSKDCYMCFGATLSEGSKHSHFIYKCQDVLDCETLFDCKDSYEGIDSENCTNCTNFNQCENCYQCDYVKDCKDCSFCIGCIGLEYKKYYYLNQEYSKEEFEIIKTNLIINKDSIIKQWKQLIGENPVGDRIIGSNDCTGNNIYYSNNCIDCSNIKNCEDCKFISYNPNAKDSYDIDYAAPKGTNMMYEGLSSLGTSISICVSQCRDSSNMYYCFENQFCQDCFGCVGLRNKQYCIFNRQYENKEKYEEQVNKIIQHMMTTGERGEFFHPSLSPFGYNETVAQEYYPAVAEGNELKAKSDDNKAFSLELSAFGYHRSHYEAPTPQVDKIIKGQDLPDSITEIDDSILKVAIQCEVSGKPFRIIPQELAFYRKHNIPLPRKHPDVRHLERMELRR